MDTKWLEVQGEQSGERDVMWNGKNTLLTKGDILEGRYVSRKDNVGDNKSKIYTIEQEDGEKMGVWGSTVLDDRMSKIAIGKMVKIEYGGMGTGKSGRPYHTYKVFSGIDTPGDEA